MGLTKAERHNRMLNNVFDHYNKHQKSLPCCHLYQRYLQIAVDKFKITENEARNKYNLYTVEKWESLLNLGWNKN
jgi:hypothetical protein